jgi:YHS domain-containing protein
MKTFVIMSVRFTLVCFMFVTCTALHLFSQTSYNVDKNGVAIKGYDVVSYFVDSKPQEGTPGFAHEWMGAKWHFASAEHLAAFKAAPEKYAPEFGGYCSYGVCMKNGKYAIDPTAWKIIDGKLYLNYNKNTETAWAKEGAQGIGMGNENWKSLKMKK